MKGKKGWGRSNISRNTGWKYSKIIYPLQGIH